MGFDIKGKNVLVTGANRGIGKAILEEALRRGAAKVYAAVRDVTSAEPLVKEHGKRVVAVRVDLDEPASITQAATSAGDVHVVVNNAGVMKTCSAMAADAIKTLQYEIDANVYGLMRVAAAFAPVLKANGGGALVQLNSIVSVKTFPEFATYSASKAASYAITQGLRGSLREQGTLVVSVHPGPIKTDMGASAGFNEIADAPEVVATSIFDAIAKDQFHVWPDKMAMQIGEAYEGFAKNVVEADLME